MKTKYHRTFLCGSVVFSSATVHQTSKSVMLLSQVKLEGNVSFQIEFNVTLFKHIV